VTRARGCFRDVTADVAGSTGDQNVHRRSLHGPLTCIDLPFCYFDRVGP
jgi:hypothetical protein